MIHRIGADDPRLEPYRRIGDSVWLRDRHLFVGESRLVVERILSSGRFDVRSVLVTPTAWEALSALLERLDADVFLCAQRVVNDVTGYNFHRGCLALVGRPAPIDPASFLDNRLLIALEGIGNPDNIGGIFRCAAAFGAGGILLDPRSGDPLYRKAVRTSMGAALHVPYARLEHWPQDLLRFRAAGMRLVALTPHGSAAPLAEFAATMSPDARFVFLFGSEGAGLAESTMEIADAAVQIPIRPGVDSLNVVVAAGIALDRIRGSVGIF